jgi:hypothetical protein
MVNNSTNINKNEHSSPKFIEHKKTMKYDARNSGHSLAQAQKCGGA